MAVFMTLHLKKVAQELAFPSVAVQEVSCSSCLACVYPDMLWMHAESLERTRNVSFLELVSPYRRRPKIHYSFGRLRYSCILNRFQFKRRSL